LYIVSLVHHQFNTKKLQVVKVFWWKATSHFVPLFTIERSILLRTLQQRQMSINAFKWTGQPPRKKCPFPWGMSTPI